MSAPERMETAQYHAAGHQTRGARRWHRGPSRRGRLRNSRSGGPPPANNEARTRPGWGSRGPQPGRASSGSSGEATRPAPSKVKLRFTHHSELSGTADSRRGEQGRRRHQEEQLRRGPDICFAFRIGPGAKGRPNPIGPPPALHAPRAVPTPAWAASPGSTRTSPAANTIF
jgi:hypothetical protein